MHPEGRLPLDLLFSLRTGVVVDVVVVNVLGALPAYEGPAGAQGQSERPLVRTGDGRGGRPWPHQGLDSEARPGEGPALRRAGARRVPDDGGGLTAGCLQDTGQVFIQDGLGVLVGGAREECQRMWGELGSTSHDLCFFSFLLLVKTNKKTYKVNIGKKQKQQYFTFSEKNQSPTNLLDLLQPLFQRVNGVLLSLQALQPGDELGCEFGWFHWDHLLGRTTGSLWAEKKHTLAVASSLSWL